MSGHGAASGHGHGRRAIFAALVANLGIAVAKLVAWAITRSSAMLAESAHSIADTGNQALLLLGGKRARREPDAAHPFGYGRERYFWAFVVALVLFSLGALFAVYEGVEKLAHPHELESPAVAVVVLLLAIGLESFSMRTAVKEAAPLRRSGEGWGTFIRRAKNPELPVVLLEDLGALIGLVVALGGVGLSLLTGNSAWDGYATLVIGGLLGVIAFVLAAEMQSLLVGEAAAAPEEAAVREVLESAPRVRHLIHLRTLHLGPEEILVAAKVDFDPTLTFPEVAAAIDAAEVLIRERVPTARMIYVEPDVHREVAG